MARPTVYETWEAHGLVKRKISIIKGMSAVGATQLQISKALGITDVSFRKLMKEYPKIEDAFYNGKEVISGMIRDKRLDMALNDKTVPPELKEKMLRDLERQYNNYKVEADDNDGEKSTTNINIPIILRDYERTLESLTDEVEDEDEDEYEE